MNGVSPIPTTAVFNRGSLVEESPCKSCRHWQLGPGPSVCIDWPDCALRIPRQRISCYSSPEFKSAPRRPITIKTILKSCPFEGCNRKTQYEACWTHRRTIERRKARGVTGEALYLAGDIRGAQ